MKVTEFFIENPFLKTVSLCLAFFLWLTVHDERNIEVSTTVPIVVKDLPNGLAVVGDLENEVRIRVVGPRMRLLHMKEHGLSPSEINLSDARPGVNSYTLEEENFHIPRGARMKQISPSTIRITLDHSEERLVRVEPRFAGTLGEGFELTSYEVSPQYIKIRAARADLDSLTSLRTDPISFNDRTDSFAGEYSVRGYRSQWELQDKKVSVRVNIREKEISKILESVPVMVAGASKSYKVHPNTVAMRIKGPAGKVSSVLAEKFDISLDAGALGFDRQKKQSFRVHLAAPKRPGVEITMIPDIVRLTRD